jgi:hypothetical protein
VYPAPGSPDPAPSPIRFVDAGPLASDTPRLRRRGQAILLTARLEGLRQQDLPGRPTKSLRSGGRYTRLVQACPFSIFIRDL